MVASWALGHADVGGRVELVEAVDASHHLRVLFERHAARAGDALAHGAGPAAHLLQGRRVVRGREHRHESVVAPRLGAQPAAARQLRARAAQPAMLEVEHLLLRVRAERPVPARATRHLLGALGLQHPDGGDAALREVGEQADGRERLVEEADGAGLVEVGADELLDQPIDVARLRGVVLVQGLVVGGLAVGGPDALALAEEPAPAIDVGGLGEAERVIRDPVFDGFARPEKRQL